jgi:hypothetical protein
VFAQVFSQPESPYNCSAAVAIAEAAETTRDTPARADVVAALRKPTFQSIADAKRHSRERYPLPDENACQGAS